MSGTRFDPTPTAAEIAEWAQILFTLLGDGLTSEPDTLRYAEITSYAYVFAFADNVLTQAGREHYVQSALDTLDEHEAGLRLPNDSGVTDSERKARVLALRSLRGMNDASLGRVFAALGSIGPGEYRGVTSSEMSPELGLESFHALTSVLVANAADLAEPRIKQALSLILDRGLDVSRFGPNHVKGSRVLATAVGAVWGTGAPIALDGNPQRFGSVALDRSTDATAEETPRWNARLRSFGPLTVVHTDDMRRVARGLALQPDNGPTSVSAPTMTGDLKCVASVSIAAGTNVTVEDVTSWKNRLVIYTGQAATTDIRPGGAAEDGDASRITPGMLDTAAGGVGNAATLIANVELYADAGVGLRIRNTGGVTVYVNIFAWASSPYTLAGTPPILDPFGLSGAGVTGINATLWNAFVAYLATKRGGSTAAWATGELRGLVHRTCMTPNTYTPASGGLVEYVLDSSLDWRDRFVVLSAGGFDVAAGGVKFPGAWNQDTGTAVDKAAPTNAYAPFLFGYTGPGRAAGSLTSGQWDIVIGGVVTAHVYANSTTGALTLAVRFGDAPPTFAETFIVNIIGSFQLGVKVTPSAVAPTVPTATAGAAMRPSQFDVPQDYAIQDYGRGAEAATADLLTVPLGLDVYGSPPVARVCRTRRDRVTGYVQDSGQRLYRRERTDGGATCFFLTVAGYTVGHHLLDSTQDWRDRWIYQLGTTDVGTKAARGVYTGPGMSAAAVAALPATGYYAKLSSAGLYLYADTAGSLYLYVTGATTIAKGIVIGSPHLGGHAVPSLRRASERALLDLGALHWYTARRCTVTGSAVRRVSYRDARAGVVHNATVLGGFVSGSPAAGFAPVYGTGSRAAAYPWVGSRARGVPPAMRLRSYDSGYWATNLVAGSWDFLHQGPMTFAFVFAMVDVTVPYPDEAFFGGLGTSFPGLQMFGTIGVSSTAAGMALGIDPVSETLVHQRQDGSGTLVQRMRCATKVRDGEIHTLVIRQSAATIEIYIDGNLDTTAATVATAVTSINQPALTPYFNGFGQMPQAGFDLFETAWFNTAITDAQLHQLQSYLKRTYSKRTGAAQSGVALRDTFLGGYLGYALGGFSSGFGGF